MITPWRDSPTKLKNQAIGFSGPHQELLIGTNDIPQLKLEISAFTVQWLIFYSNRLSKILKITWHGFIAWWITSVQYLLLSITSLKCIVKLQEMFSKVTAFRLKGEKLSFWQGIQCNISSLLTQATQLFLKYGKKTACKIRNSTSSHWGNEPQQRYRTLKFCQTTGDLHIKYPTLQQRDFYKLANHMH